MCIDVTNGLAPLCLARFACVMAKGSPSPSRSNSNAAVEPAGRWRLGGGWLGGGRLDGGWLDGGQHGGGWPGGGWPSWNGHMYCIDMCIYIIYIQIYNMASPENNEYKSGDPPCMVACPLHER